MKNAVYDSLKITGGVDISCLFSVLNFINL